MVFPKLNLAVFWILSFAVIIVFAFVICQVLGITEIVLPQYGWTAYPPLSNATHSPNIGADLWGIGIILVGTSSTMGAVNFLSTVFNMRAKNMTFFQMPLLTWSIVVTSFLILASTPVLTSALIMLQLERTFPDVFFFFSPQGGGDPILYQHLFWFYSHPAVYIMILPGFGIINEIIPTFSRKPIFGYAVMVWSMIAIAVLGFVVWAHHMFTTGIGTEVRAGFMILTMLIGVPTGLKVFSWLGTIWGGSLKFSTAMLFALRLQLLHLGWRQDAGELRLNLLVACAPGGLPLLAAGVLVCALSRGVAARAGLLKDTLYCGGLRVGESEALAHVRRAPRRSLGVSLLPKRLSLLPLSRREHGLDALPCCLVEGTHRVAVVGCAQRFGSGARLFADGPNLGLLRVAQVELPHHTVAVAVATSPVVTVTASLSAFGPGASLTTGRAVSSDARVGVVALSRDAHGDGHGHQQGGDGELAEGLAEDGGRVGHEESCRSGSASDRGAAPSC